MDLLAHMQVFVRIAEMRSLSRAARAMRVSLPTVSRQLRELEAELGQSLVARTTRRLALTEAGERFYGRAVPILRAVDEAKLTAAEGVDVAGVVVISAPVTAGLVRIGPGLSALRARYQRLVVELRLEDHVADLVADGVDIAVRASTQRNAGSDVIARKVGSWPNVLVAAPSYLRRHAPPQSASALARHRLLAHVGADRRPVVWRLSRSGKTTSVPIEGGFRTNNVLLLRELAIHGDGIALLPEWLAAQALSSGQLARVLPNHEGHTTFAFLVHRPAPPPRVRVVLDVLAELLRPPRRFT
jgi:DNA-binding transcriptional LysR family regulator